MAAPTTVTQAELARFLRRDVTTIQAWQADGMPVKKPGKKRGQASAYDLADCIEWMVAHEVEKASEGTGSKARRERIDTARAELALYREAGKVVAVDTVTQILDRWLEEALNVMEGIEEKYAVRIPQVATDDTALRETLRTQMRELREALADIDLATAFAGSSEGDQRQLFAGDDGGAGEAAPTA